MPWSSIWKIKRICLKAPGTNKQLQLCTALQWGYVLRNVSLGISVAVWTSQNALTPIWRVQPATVIVVPYFYTTGSSVGLFTPASPQTREKCIVLQHYDTLRSPNDRNFSAPFHLMGPALCMLSVVDQNIVIKHMHVQQGCRLQGQYTSHSLSYVPEINDCIKLHSQPSSGWESQLLRILTLAFR